MTTETITTARMMQRRLRAATRRKTLTASRTRELGQCSSACEHRVAAAFWPIGWRTSAK